MADLPDSVLNREVDQQNDEKVERLREVKVDLEEQPVQQLHEENALHEENPQQEELQIVLEENPQHEVNPQHEESPQHEENPQVHDLEHVHVRLATANILVVL